MQKYIEQALKFLDSFYPKCDIAILFGSVVTGTNGRKSDLDIMIIDTSIFYSRHSKETFEDNEYDVLIHPKSKIMSIIWADIQRKNGIQIMLGNCVILKDSKDEFGKELIAYIKYFSKKIYPSYSEIEKENIRMKISSSIDDLHNEHLDFVQKLFVVNNIYSNLINLDLNNCSFYLGKGKQKAKLHKQAYIERYNILNKSLMKFMMFGKMEELIKTSTSLLEIHGGKLYTKQIINYIENGEKIRIISPKVKLLLDNIEYLEALFQSIGGNIQYYYLEDTQLIIILIATKRINYKDLEANLNMISIQKGFKSDFIIELNIPPIILSSTVISTSINLQLTEFYSSLKQIKFHDLLAKEKSLNLLIILLIGKKINTTIESYGISRVNFWNKLFDEFLPSSYDKNTILSFESHQLKRESKLMDLEKYFKQNANSLSDMIYKNKLIESFVPYKTELEFIIKGIDRKYNLFVSDLSNLNDINFADFPIFQDKYDQQISESNKGRLHVLKELFVSYAKILLIKDIYIPTYILSKI